MLNAEWEVGNTSVLFNNWCTRASIEKEKKKGTSTEDWRKKVEETLNVDRQMQKCPAVVLGLGSEQ